MSRKKRKMSSTDSFSEPAPTVQLGTPLDTLPDVDTLPLAEAATAQRPQSGVLGRQLALGHQVTEYARKIVAGEILAGMWARLACERHLKDLKRSEANDPKFPYRFDPEKAGRLLYWLELMPHIEGEWGSPTITLELWQKFTFGAPFGWIHKVTGLRRFRKVYVSVGRKNGKTAILAGIGWYGLLCDGEVGPQVFNGANKLEQAMILFDAAKAMLDKRPEIFGRFGVQKRGEKRLWHPKKNGRWRPISKTPGDGGGASFFIQDEFHEAKTATMTEAMVTGQGARRQPMAWFITTAGFNIGGPCYSYELQIQKILQGTVTLETTFGIIYAPDLVKYTDPFGNECQPDDWTSLAAAMKANPNWSVSVLEDAFFAELNEAIADTAQQVAFKTKRLNIWCNAADGYYNLQDWAACADADLKLEQFVGEDCVDGLDLANKLDLCAAVLVFRRALPEIDPETGLEVLKDHYYCFLRAWQPSAVTHRKENTHYQAWAQAGRLTVTDGNITDYGRILRELLVDAGIYNLREIAFDQREAGFLLQEFEKVEGSVTQFEVPQNVQNLSEPMKWLKSLVVDRRIHHDGNPLLAWAISNVVAREDHNKNVFPRKAKDELKIDPHSALLNAMVRVRDVLATPEPKEFAIEVWS